MEVICRGIRPHLVGREIVTVHSNGKALRYPVPIGAMQRELSHQMITTVARRAKYIEIHLGSGAILIIHLGMTGNLGLFTTGSTLAPHDHVRWTLDNGMELRYRDSRRFGAMFMLTAEEAGNRQDTVFKTTGPEPFSEAFSADYMFAKAKGRSIAVKTFIMTNPVVAGVGNIYANESLFAAGIMPTRKAKSLTRKEWHRLIDKIRLILQEAINCGGSTISDFVNASQEGGYFQIRFRVYGKGGEPCVHCGKEIRRLVIGGRASYYCDACQR